MFEEQRSVVLISPTQKLKPCHPSLNAAHLALFYWGAKASHSNKQGAKLQVLNVSCETVVIPCRNSQLNRPPTLLNKAESILPMMFVIQKSLMTCTVNWKIMLEMPLESSAGENARKTHKHTKTRLKKSQGTKPLQDFDSVKAFKSKPCNSDLFIVIFFVKVLLRFKRTILIRVTVLKSRCKPQLMIL